MAAVSVSADAWPASASIWGSRVRQVGHAAGSAQAGGIAPSSRVVAWVRASSMTGRRAVGVGGVGGARDGLDEPVHGDGHVVAGGEHAVGGQPSDGPVQVRGVGECVQEGAGDGVGGVPGHDPQNLPGERVVREPVQGDPPDPCDRPPGIPSNGHRLEHGGRVSGQQRQVGSRADGRLSEVGSGLLDGQGQAAQLRTQLLGTVCLAGSDPGQQVHRVVHAKHVQAYYGRCDGVPAGREAAGDQEPPGCDPAGQRGDVGRIVDVVQHQQPPIVAGQPLQRPFAQRLQRQRS